MKGKEKGRGNGRTNKKKGSPPVLPSLRSILPPSLWEGGEEHRASQGLNYKQFTESLWLGSGGNPRLQTATPSLHFSLPWPQDRGGRM